MENNNYKKMEIMKQMLPKPSDAVWAMVNGLVEQSKRRDFRVNMKVYGDVDSDGICYGCAATCAVQYTTGVNYSAYNINLVYYRRLATKVEDLRDFEETIDTLRRGITIPLACYYDIDKALITPPFNLPPLLNDWEHYVDRYAAYAEWLEAKGL